MVLQVFDTARNVPLQRLILPPILPPFLVPAVLDALRTSDYAPVTSVVPGEAVLYCARFAKENGGIILANRSDLFLYDIGELSAISYMSRLELRIENERSIRCDRILALVSRPLRIASRLGLKDLKGLAFVVSRNTSITLPEAIRLAKGPLDESATRAFNKGYDNILSNSESWTRSPMTFGADVSTGQYLDPRISELASQFPRPTYIILPFLIDDPSRASAWGVSRKLRIFCYSLFCFRHSQNDPIKDIWECGRMGNQIIGGKIGLLMLEDTLAFAKDLAGTLGKCRRLFSRLSEGRFWRIFALREVVTRYLDNGKEPPSKIALGRVFLGAADGKFSWNDIHLSAEVEGVLYSLRMIAQLLSYLTAEAKSDQKKAKAFQNTQDGNRIDLTNPSGRLTESPIPLPAELLALETRLSTLPFINRLMLSRNELSARGILTAHFEHLLNVLASSIPCLEQIEEIDVSSDGNPWIKVWSENKSRKRRISQREDEKEKSVLDEKKKKNVLDEKKEKSVMDEKKEKSVLDETKEKSVLDEKKEKSVTDGYMKNPDYFGSFGITALDSSSEDYLGVIFPAHTRLGV